MSLTKESKTKLIESYQLHQGDTGSPDVQIAILSERIGMLTEHLKVHKKDKHSRRGLIKLVTERRRHLDYLAKYNKDRYEKLVASLKLRG